MPRKINGIEEDVIITGGVILAGYLAVKSFLPNLGVSDSDKITLDQAQTESPTDSPFNAYYAGLPAWMTQNFDISGYDNSDDAVKGNYGDFIHGNMSPDNPVYPAYQIHHGLSNALTGHIITGDQDAAKAYLAQITSKGQCAFIAYIFANVNGLTVSADRFWSVLRNGTFPMIYGLNGTDLAAAVNRINNLPE